MARKLEEGGTEVEPVSILHTLLLKVQTLLKWPAAWPGSIACSLGCGGKLSPAQRTWTAGSMRC